MHWKGQLEDQRDQDRSADPSSYRTEYLLRRRRFDHFRRSSPYGAYLLQRSCPELRICFAQGHQIR